jgi:hypothetical protein
VKIQYTRSHFAKLLGFTDKQLSAADKLPELKALGGGPDSYQLPHLSAYRRVLDLRPRREPPRRQLFLNFKGGTGKTIRRRTRPSTWAARTSSARSSTPWSKGSRSKTSSCGHRSWSSMCSRPTCE